MDGTVVVQPVAKMAAQTVPQSHAQDGVVWAIQDTNAEAIIVEDVTETGSRHKDTKWNVATKFSVNTLAPQCDVQE